MDKRELYKQKYQAQIDEWKAKLDGMHAQAGQRSAQAQLDVKPSLDLAYSKLNAAKKHLHDLADLAEEKWDASVKGSESIWEELKSAAHGAVDAVKDTKQKSDSL
jgi:hypothetical protein